MLAAPLAMYMPLVCPIVVVFAGACALYRLLTRLFMMVVEIPVEI